MGYTRRGLAIAVGGTALAAGAFGIARLGDTGRNPDETPSSNAAPETATSTETPTETPVDVPDAYVLELVPGKNQQLRDRIPEEQLDAYKEEFATELITESSVFSESAAQEWRRKPVDLLALEWWHDNDYQNLNRMDRHRGEIELFVKSIDELGENEAQQLVDKHGPIGGTELENPEEIQNRVNKAKNDADSILYPNGEPAESVGSYEPEKALNPDSLEQFLDQVHPFMFNLEWEIDRPAISTEDEKFAAALQEATDRYTNFETHYWAFDLPTKSQSTHGNGLIWNETKDELRVLETITKPSTATFNDSQHHPLIENSNYLPPELRQQLDGQTNSGNEAYQKWWHPIRFNGTEPEKQTLNFRDGKEATTDIFRGLATGLSDQDVDNTKTNVEAGISITTEYITDTIEKLRNYNNNELGFQEIINQSKVYNKLRAENEDYLIGGTVDDPWYAKVSEDFDHEAVWKDEEGEFDDYDQELEPKETESPQSLDQAGQILENPA